MVVRRNPRRITPAPSDQPTSSGSRLSPNDDLPVTPVRYQFQGYYFDNPRHRVIANNYVWTCERKAEFNCPARLVTNTANIQAMQLLDAKLIHNHDELGNPMDVPEYDDLSDVDNVAPQAPAKIASAPQRRAIRRRSSTPAKSPRSRRRTSVTTNSTPTRSPSTRARRSTSRSRSAPKSPSTRARLSASGTRSTSKSPVRSTRAPRSRSTPQSASRRAASIRDNDYVPSEHSGTSSSRRGILKPPLRRSARIAARQKSAEKARKQKSTALAYFPPIPAKRSKGQKLLHTVKNFVKSRRRKNVSFDDSLESTFEEQSAPSSSEPRVREMDNGKTVRYDYNDGSYILLAGQIPTYKALRDADHVAIDETFQLLPESYTAAVIILAKIANSYKPVVFALLSEASEKLYVRLINAILEKIPGRDPEVLDVAVNEGSPMRPILKPLFPKATIVPGKAFGGLHRLFGKVVGKHPSEEALLQAFHAQLNGSVMAMAVQTTVGYRRSTRVTACS